MKRLFALVLLMTAFTFANASVSYKATIDSITVASADSVSYKITITNTGTDTLKMSSFATALSFPYQAMSNGGTITAGYKSASSDSNLPTIQRTPNVSINSSLQISISFKTANASVGHKYASGASFDLGWFYIKNSRNFKKNVLPDINWIAASTTFQVYANSGTTLKSIAAPMYHTVNIYTPYKVYAAWITQTTTATPTVTVAFNNLCDTTLTWSRSAEGTYYLTSADSSFVSTSTYGIKYSFNEKGYKAGISRVNNGSLGITSGRWDRTNDTTSTYVKRDALFSATYIEIIKK